MTKYLNIALVLIIIFVLGLIIFKPGSDKQQTKLTATTEPSPMPSTKTKEYEKAKEVIEEGKSYTAILKTTAGEITVELSNDTPITTNNFVFLAKEGFYDGVIFHRVISGFMIQGGDPTGTGMGGPGYRFADEDFTGEYKRGVVAMANAGPDTNGSQFFIMHADYPLPPNYVIFGMTTSGLEVVDKIASAKTGPSDRPLDPVVISSVEIIEK